jgi:two-component system, chemotaxis family, sensor kinase CheA
MSDQHKEVFREEAYEHLADLENSLLELEENPEDMELIGRVFRSMHTIKGSGSMFGFDTLAAFTHEVETVLDFVRNGRLPVSKKLISLCLAARDCIKSILDADDHDPDVEGSQTLVAAFRSLAGIEATPKAAAAAAGPQAGRREEPEITYRIRFKPFMEIFQNGTNPLALLNELRELGRCDVVSQMDNLPPLEDMNPENCYIFWDVILTTRRGRDAIMDVFIFVEDDCELKIDVIDDGSDPDGDTGYKKLGDILVERGDLSAEEMNSVLKTQKRFGELLIEQGIVSPEKVQSALVEQQHVKGVRKERSEAPPPQEAAASIRVPAERLDQLINLVGEMVTVQARLSQVSLLGGDSTFIAISEEVERLTNELRNTALNIRMLPIGSTFSKFKRLVRDLSQELGKEIEMDTFGAETELDKTVIEKLNDPLVHIIRNSIDHGIEMPDKRREAGKSSLGKVVLGAEHSGDSVLITIQDDGGGLDRDAIRNKAVERGLLAANAEVSDREIYSQIFAPGFSTAAKVTSVSGRGVGMDVVKRGIEGLRGTITVDSVRGKGTTITLKIPLTLAIIDSLLVKIGRDHFVLPLSTVEECIELTREDVRNSHGRNLANVRGAIIPYIPLRDCFCITDNRPEIEQIVIADIHGKKVGFVVDHVVGEHQTVIKSLGKMYRDVQGISGATILGDGTVALILDMGALLKVAELRETTQTR